MPATHEITTGAEFYWSPASDPLGLGPELEALPDYNAASAKEPLAEALNQGVQTAAELPGADYETATRCLNTLDLFAMSYQRAGGSPMEDIPGLETTMSNFGLAAATVPRATLSSYIRGTSLTGTPQEALFRDSLTTSYIAFEPALHALAEVDYNEAGVNDRLSNALGLTSGALDVAITAMSKIIEELPEEEFVEIIRPYFEPFVIKGVPYAASNGGQIQLPAVDILMNGRGDSGKRGDFFDSIFPYLTPEQRQAVTRYQHPDRNGNKTALQHIADTLEAGEFDRDLIVAAGGVQSKIKKFRGIHYGYAQRSWKHREAGAKGSAGEDPELLADLIIDTRDDEKTLQRLSVAHRHLTGQN